MSRLTKKLDLNLGELFVDKLMDFILIVVGFYAALYMDGCEEKKKNREDYGSLLSNFRSELKDDQGKRENMIKIVGPVEQAQSPGNLGPLQEKFDKIKTDTVKAEQMFDCLGTFIGVGAKGEATAEEAQKMQQCEPVMAELEKAGEDEASFKPISLSPFYRSDVWQLYLSDGARYFDNKNLAVQISGIYSNLRKIDKMAAEIEAMYNDEFGKIMGDVTASGAELEEMMPDDNVSEEQQANFFKVNGATISKKVEALRGEMKAHRYTSNKIQGQIEVKVEHLKNEVKALDAAFSTTIAAIEAELGKLK